MFLHNFVLFRVCGVYTLVMYRGEVRSGVEALCATGGFFFPQAVIFIVFIMGFKGSSIFWHPVIPMRDQCQIPISCFQT